MNNHSSTALFLHPDLGIGGAERLVLAFSKALREGGWETTFWVNRHEPTRSLAEAAEETIRCAQTRIPRSLGGRLQYLLALLRLRAAIKEFSPMVPAPDLIIVDVVPHVVPMLRRLYPDSAIAIYCHFPEAAFNRGLCGVGRTVYRNGLDFLEQRAYLAADRILCNSSHTRLALLRCLPRTDPARVEILPPGTPVPSCPVPAPTGRNSVFSLGRIHPSKNHRLALEVFAKARLPSWARLEIAGGYDQADSSSVAERTLLVNLADELGITDSLVWHLNPGQPDLEAIWSRTRFAFQPALEEHFGIFLIEAMAQGIPAIAINAGGPLEIIHHAKEGFLCPPDVPYLAATLAKHWENHALWVSMSARARERVQSAFSSAIFAQRVRAMSAEILKCRSCRNPPGENSHL